MIIDHAIVSLVRFFLRSIDARSRLAFVACSNLKSAYFKGNPPKAGFSCFYLCPLTAYYLPGSSGWVSQIAGVPAVLWNPRIQAGDPQFGVRANGFGFSITGTKNIPIVVQASTDLVNGPWSDVQNLDLTSGSYDFCDHDWDGYSKRFYRISAP